MIYQDHTRSLRQSQEPRFITQPLHHADSCERCGRTAGSSERIILRLQSGQTRIQNEI